MPWISSRFWSWCTSLPTVLTFSLSSVEWTFSWSLFRSSACSSTGEMYYFSKSFERRPEKFRSRADGLIKFRSVVARYSPSVILRAETLVVSTLAYPSAAISRFLVLGLRPKVLVFSASLFLYELLELNWILDPCLCIIVMRTSLNFLTSLEDWNISWSCLTYSSFSVMSTGIPAGLLAWTGV